MKYFTIKELTASATAARKGLDNMPESVEIIDNLIALGDHVLDPLRTAMGFPVIISSGYRCKALNAAVGGTPNSSHMRGLAADIDCGLKRNLQIYQWLLAQKLSGAIPISELVWENGGAWVHVAL